MREKTASSGARSPDGGGRNGNGRPLRRTRPARSRRTMAASDPVGAVGAGGASVGAFSQAASCTSAWAGRWSIEPGLGERRDRPARARRSAGLAGADVADDAPADPGQSCEGEKGNDGEPDRKPLRDRGAAVTPRHGRAVILPRVVRRRTQELSSPDGYVAAGLSGSLARARPAPRTSDSSPDGFVLPDSSGSRARDTSRAYEPRIPRRTDT